MRKGIIHIANLFILAILIIALGQSYASESLVEEILVSESPYATSPASAYNTVNDEYLIIWAEAQSDCSNNIELKGQLIDATTGQKKGTAFSIYEVSSACESVEVNMPAISYDPVNDQYHIILKTISLLSKKVISFLIDENGTIVSNEVELASTTFGDPYTNFISYFDSQNEQFITGYQVNTGGSAFSTHLQRINASNGNKIGGELVIDKDDIPLSGNTGTQNFTLTYNSDSHKFIGTFHVSDASTNEIWGVFLNSATWVTEGDYFQISAKGTAGNQYKNATATYHAGKDEFMVIYEDVDLVGSGYEQVAKIYGWNINGTTGAKKAANQLEISSVSLTGCSGCIEQTKLPLVKYSPIKKEYMAAFFGTPTSSGSENYSIYYSRINENDFSIVDGESGSAINNCGTQVIQNNDLLPLSVNFNVNLDQYLFVWVNQQTDKLYAQIRKYTNHQPSDINLNTLVIDENQEAGTTVSSINTTDFDTDDTFTYSLVSGSGSAHNNLFAINDNQLITNEVLDFESGSSKNIRLRTTDAFGESFEKTFAIQIQDINDNPKDILLSENTIEENAAQGTLVGLLTALDDDLGNTHNFELVSGEGDIGNDNFIIDDNQLLVNGILNYEGRNPDSIRIKVMDNEGGVFEKIMRIYPTDVNEAPTDIQLSENEIQENNLAPVKIGNVLAIDEDAGDSHTFTMDESDDFYLDGNELFANISFDYEQKSSYYVTIQTKDAQDNAFKKSVEIHITDANDSPSGIALKTNSIDENLPPESKVDSLLSVDQDTNDSYSYEFIEGGSYPDNALFEILDNKLFAKESFDFESKGLYQIKLKSTDQGGETVMQVLDVQVNDVNEAPIGITYDNDTIRELLPIGTDICNLSTEDPDIDDDFTYEVIQGADYFKTNGNILQSKKVFTIENGNSYEVVVKSTDKGGLSYEKTLTIYIDQYDDSEAPVIHNTNFIFGYPFSSDYETISIEATDNNHVHQVNFYHKKITDPEWEVDQLTANEDVFEAEIRKTSMLDEMGMTYFFEVSDLKNKVYTDTVDLFLTYSASDQLAIEALDFGGNSEDYQIIAFPHDLQSNSINQLLIDDLGEQDPNTWRILSYEDGECCSEFPESLTTVKRGKGYWFNQKEQNSITIGAAEAPKNTDKEPYILELKAGWNQIGNPYPFEINWADVIAHEANKEIFLNGKVSNSIYQFKNGSFVRDGNLETFSGAFVSAEENVTIEIPLYSTDISGGRTAAPKDLIVINDQDWQLPIQLAQGSKEYKLGAIGMHADADDSKDKYDELLIPRFGNYLDISFEHSEYFYPHFARDIVEAKENYSWIFTASAFTGGDTEMSWPEIELEDRGKSIYLLDLASGGIIDMSDKDSYHYHLSAERKFKIIYGDQDFVKKELANINAIAGKAYPNPFSDNLKIPLTLPTNEKGYSASLEIYSTVGAMIYSKDYENINQHLVQLNWDGRKSSGHTAENGIYIYKIIIENTNSIFTGKVMKY